MSYEGLGKQWEATPQGPTTYLLKRPGAVRFVSHSELNHEPKRETKWHDGLEYRPELKAWVRA